MKSETITKQEEIRNFINSLDEPRMDRKVRIAASKFGYTEGGIKSLYYGTNDRRKNRSRSFNNNSKKRLNHLLQLGYQPNIITKYLAS